MSVLRLAVVNKVLRNFPCIVYSFTKPYQFFFTLSNSRISSCRTCQALKFDKLVSGKNVKNSFRFYSQTKLSKIKYTEQKGDLDTESKVIFNSVIKKRGFIATKRLLFRLNKHKIQSEVNCVALKYFNDEIHDQSDKPSTDDNTDYNVESKLNLPYSIHKSVLMDEGKKLSSRPSEEKSDINKAGDTSSSDDETDEAYNAKKSNIDGLINDNTFTKHKNWMFDYESYKIEEDIDEDFIDNSWKSNYGTSDPNIPISKVPCGGCGALLHCQDPAIPGYLPKELFAGITKKELRKMSCQRCHFLKEYNTALNISIDPSEYPKILSKIKDEKALVILMVDMTDFPCSIWPGIFDIIGPKRPIFVVGNKVDLLQGDSKNWLDNAKKSLQEALPANTNVKYLAVISAKTGFGVEQLINKLFNFWENRGDVYLVGCTNVGKSTLFNSLLQSDYCKVKAVDLLQRATTSPWPGTTLNLLKFPILRPEGWRLFYRSKRLQEENMLRNQEKKLLQQQNSNRKIKPWANPLNVIEPVGWTFKNQIQQSEEKIDTFSLLNQNELKNNVPGSGLDPEDKDFIHGRWFYDTPGTVQPDQIINLLTIDELMITLPKQMIIPRTFKISPNQSLFIGGLGRLDYLSGKKNLKFTVFASASLPVTVCNIDDAEEVYNHYLGTKVLGVPFGDESRLKAWPGLHPGQEFVLRGLGPSESCADVVLSSAGWIAVTPQTQMICKFLAWTPNARGIHIRIPSVLPYAVQMCGKLISQTIAYNVNK